MTLWQILGLPALEIFVLVGIHTYLGLHVLRRGVIFVDLALAQVAALGGLVAFLVGLHAGGLGATIFSLLFALMGAALFAALRLRGESRVPQEALIGLVYASASAVGLLLMAKAPEGAEHLRETLAGKLLWVQWSTVIEAMVLVALVASVHWFARGPLMRLSESEQGSGVRAWLWDFLFYASFALVVTHAVRTAGVLMVFVMLVAPASLAMNLSGSFKKQLLIGWAVGVPVCVLGMALSYRADLPVAPSVVAMYATVLGASGLWRWMRAGNTRRRALAGLAFCLASALLLISIVRLAADEPHDGATAKARAASAQADMHKAKAPAEERAARLLEAMQNSFLPEEQQEVCAGVKQAGVLRQAYERAQDPSVQVALAACLMGLDASQGRALLLKVQRSGSVPELLRQRLRDLLASSSENSGR